MEEGGLLEGGLKGELKTKFIFSRKLDMSYITIT